MIQLFLSIKQKNVLCTATDCTFPFNFICEFNKNEIKHAKKTKHEKCAKFGYFYHFDSVLDCSCN